MMERLDIRIVRPLSDAVSVLIEENFDGFVVEGEIEIATGQATNARQHFPSLKILCLVTHRPDADQLSLMDQQDIRVVATNKSSQRLQSDLNLFVDSLGEASLAPSEGIDPCHSLIGNLNQFSAPEILQMSCLSQRSGRFTFKSSRGISEIYLQQGSVRHAVYGTLHGESAVAEIFRWRQGRFYFEEGIISQEQTVNRPWAHLLIDNLQKLDETLELVSV